MTARRILESLYDLHLYLKALQIENLHIPVIDDNKVEKLLFSIGQDNQNRDLSILVFYLNDVLRFEAGLELPEDEPEILQFYSVLPIEVEPGAISQLQYFLTLLNQIVAVGGFNYTEKDGVIHTYRLLQMDRKLHKLVVLNIIDLIRFFIQTFSDSIDAVAKGTKSAETALKDAELALGTPPEKAL